MREAEDDPPQRDNLDEEQGVHNSGDSNSDLEEDDLQQHDANNDSVGWLSLPPGSEPLTDDNDVWYGLTLASGTILTTDLYDFNQDRGLAWVYRPKRFRQKLPQ